MNRKVIAFVAVMGALGNVLGLFSLPIPAPIPQGRIELHFSQLPSLFVAFTAGPIPSALTGLLSVILATIKIGNPFIPLGNAILAGVAGLLIKRLRPFFRRPHSYGYLLTVYVGQHNILGRLRTNGSSTSNHSFHIDRQREGFHRSRYSLCAH